MAKKVAVLAVNPVNGFGLFQYLKHFSKMAFPIKYLQWQKRKKSRRIPALPSWQMT